MINQALFFLRKIKVKKIEMSSAAIFIWHFKGLSYFIELYYMAFYVRISAYVRSLFLLIQF